MTINPTGAPPKIAFEDFILNLSEGAVSAVGFVSLQNRQGLIDYAVANTPEIGFIAAVDVSDNLTVGFKYTGTGNTFLEPELAGWEPIAPFYLEQWGVVTGPKAVNGTDYTQEVQAALDGSKGELLFTGFVKITDKVICPNTCTPHVPQGRQYGGFNIFEDFNFSATCVLQPGVEREGATIGDFGMWFQQRNLTTTRAGLNQYPPAINIGFADGEDAIVGSPTNFLGVTRGYIKSLRIEGGWDGIIGVGNCGGYRFGVIELGCFNRNVDIDGALDFIHADSFQIWLFGYSGVANLTNIFYDGETVALRLGRVDNWTCDKFSSFRCKIILGDGAGELRLPYQFGSVALDGDDALLELVGGSSQISRLYSTKNSGAPEAERDITCSAGVHNIGAIQLTSSSDGSIFVTGGSLSVNGGDIKHLNNGRRAALVQGGNLSISDVAMRWDAGSSRTAPFFEQTSGSMQVSGCYIPDFYTGRQSVVKYTADNQRNRLDGLGLEPHTCQFEQDWNLGFYRTSGRVSYVSGGGDGENIDLRRINSTGDGYELSFERAFGNTTAPAVPTGAANIGDIAFKAFDGDNYNAGAFIRGTLRQDAVDGNTPVRVEILAEDTGGTLRTPATFDGDNVTFNAETTFNSPVSVVGTLQTDTLRVGATPANEISIYEEGTWTPVISDQSGNIAATGLANGHYTRIGSCVTVQIRVQDINTAGLETNEEIVVFNVPNLSIDLTYRAQGACVLSSSTVGVGFERLTIDAPFAGSFRIAAHGDAGSRFLTAGDLQSSVSDFYATITYVTTS